METLTVILLAQNPKIEETIMDYLQNISSVSVVLKCKSPIQMIEMMPKNRVDLLFFEADALEMPLPNLMQMLRQRPFYLMAIVQHSGDVLQLLEDGANDVLQLPSSLPAFSKKICKLRHLVAHNSPIINELERDMVSEPQNLPLGNCHTILKQGRKKKMLPLEQISFVQNVGNELHVFLDSDESGIFTKSELHQSSLNKFFEQLPKSQFARVNRSFIVNCKKIEKIERQFAYIGAEKFKISRRFSGDFMETLKKV